MPLVINPNDRTKVVDRTDSLIQIPNTVGITNLLGLFTPTFSSQKTVEITRTKRGSTLLEDRNWDERNQTIAGRQVRVSEAKPQGGRTFPVHGQRAGLSGGWLPAGTAHQPPDHERTVHVARLCAC